MEDGDSERDSEDSPQADSKRALAALGYRQTESTCTTDGCNGELWYDNSTLVCRECSNAIDLDQRRRRQVLDDPWETFNRERPRYYQSNIPRMVGGFLGPYDWVTADEVDGRVSDVDELEFYR